MAFGKSQNQSVDSDETVVSETQNYVHIDDDDDETVAPTPTVASDSRARAETAEKDPSKPLLEEVTFIGAGNSKNAGGAKQWICNHCKGKYTSSYTRMHVHFFGPPVGKKAEIKRCPVMVRDRAMYDTLMKKVKSAENSGVSKSLRNSVLSKSASSNKRLDESFAMLERHTVDMKITRGLCANGIPFNVLRNPQWVEMVDAIRRAPVGYKPPSCEKTRTVLLDECVREVENDLTPVKSTWYTQGVSIVSDGWSNTKKRPLINVVAVNSRGAMFMYAEDFSGVEKSGVEIAKFLLVAIETIGPSNVLQVVTDKAGPHKKWDMNPESDYIDGSSARLEDMVWENLEGEDVENQNEKRQRVE